MVSKWSTRSPRLTPLNNFRFFIKPIRRDDHSDRPADRFGGSVAEQSFGALIPAGDDRIQILADNGVVGRINDSAQQSAGILALFTFGNITCLRFDVVDVDGMLISHFILHGTILIYHTQSTEEFIHASNDIMEV